MSCDVAVAAFLMFTSGPQSAPSQSAIGPMLIPAAAPVSSVATEPLFKDIVGRAGKLKAEVGDYRKALAGAPAALTLPAFDEFRAEIGQLSTLDEQGHVLLKQRGTDGDLTCILHGISQDLGLKLAAVAAAKTGHDQDQALRDMAYLLNDNIEVITAPPRPPA
jgi:hypothetical protein